MHMFYFKKSKRKKKFSVLASYLNPRMHKFTVTKYNLKKFVIISFPNQFENQLFKNCDLT